MRKLALVALVLALTGCAAQQRGDRRSPASAANPSAVIATELSFARAARERGMWTAFRDFATKDAIWPTPQWASVQASLKDEADPAQAIVWEPDAVWMSCDGSYAFSTGPARHRSGHRSRFTTIWQRQGNGDYRWVLDQGVDLEADYAAREMISARVADCPAPPVRRGRREPPRRGLDWSSGASDDGTLVWATTVRPDCSRLVTVTMAESGVMSEVVRLASAAPVPPAGTPAPSCPS